MLPVTNISTYKFAPLSDLKTLREDLISRCKDWNLKGTILLSTEGINLFVAGPGEQIDALVGHLKSVPGLHDLTPKKSESDHQPFTRMLVKIKKEIISFGVEGIDPAKKTSPKLPAKTLKQWLDEGKEVLLLDTRNDYEVKLGTFEKALPIGINHFRDFPKAVRALPSTLKDKPIVMFCTGGIRCEKAGPFMEKEGFKHIFQLDGGILKYFEEVGKSHYEGNCFVFDQRVGVDPSLHETLDKQCFLCLAPLTVEDQADERYILGKSCPYCFITAEEKLRRSIEERQRAIEQVTNPLPGKAPYDLYRPLKIPATYEGKTLFDFVTTILAHHGIDYWENEFRESRFFTNEKNPVTKDHLIHAGERYLHLIPCSAEPDVNVDIKILYEDEAILVINKPAPLPMHPGGRFNRNTLQSILNRVYEPAIPRPAHRLDASTSGVVVFARSKHFAGLLQPQFFEGNVKKTYLVKVKGHPPEDRFTCRLPISMDPIENGGRNVSESGLPAETQFEVLNRLSDGTSLIRAYPITGRTNQIRVHLWKSGFPIVGDPFYLSDQKFGSTLTHAISDEPLCLHAEKIVFTHPVTKKRVEFTCSPNWHF